jgi:mono/diheme cytochrome c family protein
MRLKVFIFSIFSFLFGLLYSSPWNENIELEDTPPNKYVIEFLNDNGVEGPLHYIKDLDSAKIQEGEDLVTIGYTRRNKINTKRISKHFVCINCHNTQAESNDLKSISPEIRFDYMMKNKLPFLPGSTLYGVVNRSKYFVGDYEKKFGQLALNARDTLSNAIQLCAEISSEGRKLEDWELESIMHYLNSIQLHLYDLNFNQDEIGILKSDDKSKVANLVQQKYTTPEKATFGFPQAANIRQKGIKGDWKKGEYIFKFGCMHCHNPEGITVFTLEEDQFNRTFLRERLDKTNNRSIYEITRKGTQPKKIKKTYMPLYTYEKLTDEQLEHLAAYLNYKPKNK